MAAQPKVKSFLICDQAIQGVDGKHSVIGVFQRVHAAEFPVFHHRFGLYIRLGEMRGAYRLTVQFVDPESERELAKAVLEGIRHERPLDDFETSVNLPGLEIPRAGTFEVRLFANDELIHIDTLRAAKVSLKGQQEGDESGEPDTGGVPGGPPDSPPA